MTFEVRRATLADAEACLAVHRRATTLAYAHIFEGTEYPEDAERAAWQRNFADGGPTVIVAVAVATAGTSAGTDILGTVVYEPEVLRQLYVVPDAWGRGIGSALHDEVVRAQRALGAGAVRLAVLEENTRARAFYERRGWRFDGRRWQSKFPPHPWDLGYTLDLS